MEQIKFTCKKCGKQHLSTETSEFGVPLLPDTITTERDSQLCWFFCCVQCPPAKSMPA